MFSEIIISQPHLPLIAHTFPLTQLDPGVLSYINPLVNSDAGIWEILVVDAHHHDI